MEAKLIVVGGKANKKTIALKPPTNIGRSRDADLTIPHPMISRQHCEVFETDGLLMVRDLGSLNGTMVGGRRVKEVAAAARGRVYRRAAHVSGGVQIRGRPEQAAEARVGRRGRRHSRPLSRSPM